jgi:hypothetical protein
MFGRKTVMTIALALAVCVGRSHAGDDPWFSTAHEIAHAYKYQVQFGARLRNPLKPESCSYGQKDFTASYQGRQFAAPCRFISETIRQLRELLESGTAKYLFPLDVDHGDFAIPADVWEAKYKKLSAEEILPKLLREPKLMAIYHTAVHLNAEANRKESATNIWGQKRTVVGFYNGRPNEVLPKRSHKELYFQPGGLVRFGGFTMMGHQLGELVFMSGETVVVFDMSFDNDRAASDAPSEVTVTARTE